MPVPEVTCGPDVILGRDAVGNTPTPSSTYLVSLSATATNSPTGWIWTMIGYPSGSNAPSTGDFVGGQALVQNPTFEADLRGTYVCQAIATNVDGPSDPRVDGDNAQQVTKIASWLTETYLPGKGQLNYDDELNTLLETYENRLARVPDSLNVKNFGAAGTGVVDDSAAFELAMDAANVLNPVIDIPPGNYKLDTDITLRPDTVFRFQRGSKLVVPVGRTLTLDRTQFIAGPWQVIDALGTIAGSDLIADKIYAQWFGVSTSASASTNTSKLNQLFASIGDNKHVEILPGVYEINAQVSVKNDNLAFRTTNGGVATFNLTPSAETIAFKFQKDGAAVISGLRIEGIRFTSTDNTHKKTAVSLINAFDCDLARIVVAGPWSDAIANTIGLFVQAVDNVRIRTCDVEASTPIRFGGIGATGSVRFTDMTLRSSYALGSCVLVESPTVFDSMVFDGVQRWYGGRDGFNFPNIAPVGATGDIRIYNVEHSAESADEGFTINIARVSDPIRSLLCENVVSTGVSDNDGFKFRKVETVTLINCQHKNGSSIALDAQNVDTLILNGCRFEPGATVTLTSMQQLFGLARETAQNASAVEVFVSSSIAAPFSWQQGVARWCGRLVLADSGEYTLPLGDIAYLSAKVGVVVVDTVGQGTGQNESGLWSVARAGAPQVVAGTTNIAAADFPGLTPASKFTLYREDNTTVKLVNKLGAECVVLVTVEFNV